jgi:hypothetical protein
VVVQFNDKMVIKKIIHNEMRVDHQGINLENMVSTLDDIIIISIYFLLIDLLGQNHIVGISLLLG